MEIKPRQHITDGTGDGERPEADWGEHVPDVEYHGDDAGNNG